MQFERDPGEPGWELRDDGTLIGTCHPCGYVWKVRTAGGRVLRKTPDEESAKQALMSYALGTIDTTHI